MADSSGQRGDRCSHWSHSGLRQRQDLGLGLIPVGSRIFRLLLQLCRDLFANVLLDNDSRLAASHESEAVIFEYEALLRQLGQHQG